MSDLPAKLERWEDYAPLAHRYLIDWLRDSPDELMAMAKGRHVWGHYRYGDRNYAEYDEDRLMAEAAEELADAINYIARWLHLREESAPGLMGDLAAAYERRCIP